MADALGTWVNEYIRDFLPAQIGRGLLAVFGFIGSLLWDILGAAFGSINFITTLPEQFTVGLTPVERFVADFTILGMGIVGTCTLATVVRMIIALSTNQNHGRFYRYFMRQAVAGGLIFFSLQIITWLIRFSNALSTSILDPNTGVANLASSPDWTTFTAFGAMMLIYGWMVWRMIVLRAKIVVLAALCISLTPLMVAIWCIPFDRAEDVAELWGAFTLGLIFIQVPQALALGIGAALITSAVTVGGTGTENTEQGVVAAFMGIGALGAAEGIHKVLNRRVFRQQNGGGFNGAQIASALKVAAMAAGTAVNPPAGKAAQTLYSVRQVHRTTQAASNTVAAAQGLAAPRATVITGPRAGQRLLPPPRG